MPYTYVNRATALLGATLSDSATSITLETGKGVLFAGASPTNPIRCKIVEGTNVEFVDSIAEPSGDTLPTVVRAVEDPDADTTAVGVAFTAAARITACVTAAMLDNLPEIDDPFKTTKRVAIAGSDFINGTNGSPFTTSVSNSGTVAGLAIDSRPGVLRLSTATNSSGAANFRIGEPNYNAFQLGLDTEFRFKYAVRISAVSDGTDTFSVLVGAIWANIPSSDGPYFFYSHGSNSGNWIARMKVATATHDINTSVPVVGNTWVTLEIRCAADGSAVRYYIDGVLVATQTANLPTAPFGMGAYIAKTAGTTARHLDCDFCYVAAIPDTPRL